MKKKLAIPKGKVAILMTVKIIDLENRRKLKYRKMESFLAAEAMKDLSILLDPEVSRELFKPKESKSL